MESSTSNNQDCHSLLKKANVGILKSTFRPLVIVKFKLKNTTCTARSFPPRYGINGECNVANLIHMQNGQRILNAEKSLFLICARGSSTYDCWVDKVARRFISLFRPIVYVCCKIIHTDICRIYVIFYLGKRLMGTFYISPLHRCNQYT